MSEIRPNEREKLPLRLSRTRLSRNHIPRAAAAREGAMRKERKSPKGLLLAVLLTAGVLGGAYYVAVIRPAANAEPDETNWTTLSADSTPSRTPASSAPFPAPGVTPPTGTAPSDSSSRTLRSSDPGSTPGTDASAGTSANRTDRIIQCHDPEIGDFFTNAVSCDKADPHNRITIAESVQTTPGEDRYSGQDYTSPEQDAGNSRSDR